MHPLIRKSGLTPQARTTMIEAKIPLLRLLHLSSPSLPTGAFAYSQGLEWAVAAGWIKDGPDLKEWLTDLIDHQLAHVDIPLLGRMLAACYENREDNLARWCDLLLALRESRELRLEEQNRGKAMLSLLEGLGVPMTPTVESMLAKCQLAGFAMAASHWGLDLSDAATGYVWSWLENQVLAGIKIIPLGQTAGHRILLQMDRPVMDAVARGLTLEDHELGASSPALAIASSRHETQYTRLYRS